MIRFDAPGTGGSQLPNLPYRFTTLALLLREMLHNLGHQQADVLWVSPGEAGWLSSSRCSTRACAGG